jgi:diadenosine tetraphosphate (Ap4A) HIT family hydrolase
MRLNAHSTKWLLLALALAGVMAGAGEPKPCVFCEIVAGKTQQESVVYRDDHVVAFLSIGQRNPGHVLIVPAAHAENFLTVPADTMHRMTDVAKRLAEAIKHTDLRMDGFQLLMSNGKAAGQAVFHAHLHLIPRFEGDAPAVLPAEPRAATGQSESLTPPKRAGDPFPQEVLAPIAAKIRAALVAADAKP